MKQTQYKYAIKIMLESNDNTLFVIEGFNEKKVSLKEIAFYIKNHYKRLYFDEDVIVENHKQSDFLVTIKNVKTFEITWSWCVSYIYKKVKYEN